jgi:DNA-binding response OmpR family regulator
MIAPTSTPEQQTTPSDTRNSALVVLAEQDALLRPLLRELLEMEGHRVLEASDGAVCLELCERHQPNLVLLNLWMPVVDGLTCCQHLTQAAIPVMIVTGVSDNDSIEQAFAAGAIDVIIKPFNWKLLRHRINRLLNHQSTQATQQPNLTSPTQLQ